jgi:hypothetical protein
MVNDEPVQIVNEKFELDIKILNDLNKGDITGADIQEIMQQNVIAFDLSSAPLINLAVLQLEVERCILLIDMHHIITDGVSANILIKDFNDISKNSEQEPLSIHYKDYAEWITTGSVKKLLHKQEEYWLTKFNEKVPPLNLPIDFQLNTEGNNEGEILSHIIDQMLSNKIREVAKLQEVTVNIYLSAVYYILLFKYTKSEDLVVGSNISGRTHPDLHDMIGMFSNAIAIRTNPQNNKSFGDYLTEVKETAFDAYENQDYSFDELVMKLGIEREYLRNPLFNTLFAYENSIEHQLEISGVDIKLFPYQHKYKKFDLVLSVFDIGDNLVLHLEFLTSIFKNSTIENILDQYIKILNQVLGNNNIRIEDINFSYGKKAKTNTELNSISEDFRL